MVTQQEWAVIFTLFKSRLSVPQISARIGRSTTTIYNLLKGGGPRSSVKKSSLFPDKLVIFKDYLDRRIRSGVTNAKKLFYEIQDQGYLGSYNLVNNYVKSYSENRLKRYKRSIRFETGPGEQAQVDWGHFGKIEINRRIEKLYCFVYVLGFSRATYIEFAPKQDLKTLQECHINAFSQLGIPKEIVYDNMKTVVLKRKRFPDGTKRISFNLGFVEFAKYYGFELNPHRPRWPRAKGKVEARVKYVRNNFMQGMRFGKEFKSLDELNLKAKLWIKNIIHGKVSSATGKKPIDKWVEEKPYLKFPDKAKRYITSPLEDRTCTKDGTTQYHKNFYSVPIEFARKGVQIREVSNGSGVPILEIYHDGELISTHQVASEQGRFISKDEHFISKQNIKAGNSKITPHIKTKNNSKNSVIVANRLLGYYNQVIPGFRYE